MIAWLTNLHAKIHRWWMWNKDEAILISSTTSRTWIVYVEQHPVCGTDNPPSEHIVAYEINRRTGEPLHEPEPSIFDLHDDFQKQFEQGRIEAAHPINPDDIPGHRHDD